jgi:hypothetical protein
MRKAKTKYIEQCPSIRNYQILLVFHGQNENDPSQLEELEYISSRFVQSKEVSNLSLAARPID